MLKKLKFNINSIFELNLTEDFLFQFQHPASKQDEITTIQEENEEIEKGQQEESRQEKPEIEEEEEESDSATLGAGVR